MLTQRLETLSCYTLNDKRQKRQGWVHGVMMETFKQFTFEAAHQTPPYSGLHGHSFTVCIYLTGEPDPVYGWTHNLKDIEAAIDGIRAKVDHKYLNDVEGLEVPTLENVTRWLADRLDRELTGVDRIIVRRGLEGQAEGCIMRPARLRAQMQPTMQPTMQSVARVLS